VRTSSKREGKVYYKTANNRGKKMIMIVKTPGSQKGSPAVAEEEAEGRGGGTRGYTGDDILACISLLVVNITVR